MRKYAGKIMRWTMVGLALYVLFFICVMPAHKALATPAITSSIIDDWAAVAEGATDESTEIDISGNYATAIHIQAFLDLDATAHEGTEFVIQLSGMSTGNEDWSDMTKFIDMVDTCNEENIDDNPLTSNSTTILLSDTGGNYEDVIKGGWIAIEDSVSAANNELVWRTGFTTDTNITCQDGTTNEHATASNCYDVAMSRTIVVPFGSGYRARVICNNGYDSDGTACSLVWKVGKTVTTDMEE